MYGIQWPKSKQAFKNVWFFNFSQIWVTKFQVSMDFNRSKIVKISILAILKKQKLQYSPMLSAKRKFFK